MKKIFVSGSTGLVGSHFVKAFSNDFEIFAPSHDELDLLDFEKVSEYLNDKKPEVVLNFAAMTNLDQAEVELDDKNGKTYKLNALLPEKLTQLSNQLGFYLLQISTDYVFDGTKTDAPYQEEDQANGLSWYAQTKLQGEEFVKTEGQNFCIVRIEMPFAGHFDKKKDFARFFLETLQASKPLTVVADQNITPLFVGDAVKALKAIIDKPTQGILHVASNSWTTPQEFAQHLADQFGLNKDFIQTVKFADFAQSRIAPRPQHCWLDVSKFISIYGNDILHSVEEELVLFKTDLEPQDAA